MSLELLGWAKAMVRDLYQHQRLSMQTLMALHTLDRQQKKDFWNYLYPLWGPLMLKPPFCIPVRQIERLAADPSKMELLSAGVGFVDDLRWEGSALPVLRAAAGKSSSWRCLE